MAMDYNAFNLTTTEVSNITSAYKKHKTLEGIAIELNLPLTRVKSVFPRCNLVAKCPLSPLKLRELYLGDKLLIEEIVNFITNLNLANDPEFDDYYLYTVESRDVTRWLKQFSIPLRSSRETQNILKSRDSILYGENRKYSSKAFVEKLKDPEFKSIALSGIIPKQSRIKANKTRRIHILKGVKRGH
jgi:hypothetical protein